MPTTHELKTDPAVFDLVKSGVKNFEIRVADRDYRVGDDLVLRRTRHTGKQMAQGMPLVYDGQEARRKIAYVMRGPIYGLAEGWCILAFKHDTPKHGGPYNGHTVQDLMTIAREAVQAVFMNSKNETMNPTMVATEAIAEACFPATMVLTCAFCGHEYPGGTAASRHELLTGHVHECDTHPLNIKNKELIGALTGIRENLRQIASLANINDETRAIIKANGNFANEAINGK